MRDSVEHCAVCQALKQQAYQAVNVIDELKEKRNLAEENSQHKHVIKDSGATGNNTTIKYVAIKRYNAPYTGCQV